MIFKRGKSTPMEQKLRDALAAGQVLNVAAEDSARFIPGYLLCKLLAEESDAGAPPGRFLHIKGARITGLLELEAVTVRCPVTFEECQFDKAIVLKEAHLVALRLPGCHVPGLAGQQLKVDRNLELNRGFTANGEVNLLDGQIGGRLELNEAILRNPGGSALKAEGLAVGQDMYCEALQADGEIRLEGARIGGWLNLGEATLHNPGGLALAADGVTVGQPMYCSNGFQADGEIHLVGMHISGMLDFGGAHLRNPGGIALNAGRLSVNHYVVRRQLQADGEIHLVSAHISGRLNFDGATLRNPGGARSIGLFCGILGGVLVVVGYIGVQAPTETRDAVTYAVIPSAATSEVRKTLGTACDVFTGVPLATDKTKDRVTLYVTGGTNCTVNKRVELPAKDIAAVNPAPTTTTPPPKTS